MRPHVHEQMVDHVGGDKVAYFVFTQPVARRHYYAVDLGTHNLNRANAQYPRFVVAQYQLELFEENDSKTYDNIGINL